MIRLRTIGNTLGSDYRLYDKLHLLFIWGSHIDRLLGSVDKYLVLTQSVYSKNDINALRFQDYKIGDKVYPPYCKIHLQT
jgi:hypothetical protein